MRLIPGKTFIAGKFRTPSKTMKISINNREVIRKAPYEYATYTEYFTEGKNLGERSKAKNAQFGWGHKSLNSTLAAGNATIAASIAISGDQLRIANKFYQSQCGTASGQI